MQAAQTLPIPSGHPAGVLDAVKAVWVDYRRDAAKRHSVQSAIAELARMDDMALADIGITRSEIAQVVMNGKR